jgi:glycosyltransferase involved in cell wall biosynthesis/predicted SAM-dependent methyltransferase
MIGSYSVSLALIAKNEESCLEKCLKSFQPISDEIIVVDTGSTDKTKEIARKFTDKIYDFEWIDDFSAARNYSFEKCTQDWIMWCDCDDFIFPEDLEKVKKLDLSDKEIVIFNYEYAHDDYGNSISTVPRERLIRRLINGKTLKWQGEIHEALDLAGKLWVSGISTHHYKKAGSSERNLKILERVVKKNPDNSRFTYYYAREMLDIGEKKGAEYLEKFVSMPGAFWEDVYLAHYRLAEFYMSKDENKFKEHLYRSLSIEERRAEPFYLFGQYWESKQQWDRAIQWFECCLRVRRPMDLLACYQPDFYGIKPCVDLVVCFNSLGNLEKALEYNEKALSYQPQNPGLLNNKKILTEGIRERKIKARKDGQGKRLNLGCGNKSEPGFTNVDIVKTSITDELFEFDDIPYIDNSIGAIHSEHALEHVGYERIDRTLKEWFRVLVPGGQLFLKIPDLEACCRNYIMSTTKEDRDWFRYTIYGIQKSQAGEPDEAQYHKWGFSKKEICEKLEEIGFIIDYAEHYDGWKTPSLALLGVKPVSNIKVGWISFQNWEAAQTRIRDLRVNRWLRSRGYKSQIVSYDAIISDNYDVCVIGRDFGEESYKRIQELKGLGKTIIADLCESLFEFPHVTDTLKLCNLAVCCSRELERQVKEKVGIRTVIIEDAFE